VGRLTEVDHEQRRARVQPHEGAPRELHYDHLVVGLGAESRVFPIPGLADQAVGFQSLPEATYLRDHVLERLESADATTDEAARRRALTFVFVGGGYTGVEALGELDDMARAARQRIPRLRGEHLRWVLVEATDRILPTVAPGLREVAAHELRRRGVEIFLETQLESAEGGRLALSDGRVLEADTLVWSAGMRPPPGGRAGPADRRPRPSRGRRLLAGGRRRGSLGGR